MSQKPSYVIRDLPQNPFLFFSEWKEKAKSFEINDPAACCLATVDSAGKPHARMVLVKSFDERGFIFHTNGESNKGQQIAENPHVALCFHWKSLRRQIRIEGTVEETAPEDADDYFASRSRESRLGAWASQQSRPLEKYEDLIAAHKEAEAKFEGQDVPRPPHWKGYRVIPARIEFWIDGPHRLHQRFVYEKQDDSNWAIHMLHP